MVILMDAETYDYASSSAMGEGFKVIIPSTHCYASLSLEKTTIKRMYREHCTALTY